MSKILFLHGMMGEGADWAEVSLKLKNSCPHYTIHCPTLPYFQEQDQHKSTFDPTQEVFHQIKKIWQDLSPDIVIGYSMGGRIAWELSHYSHCPKYLILESCHPGLVSQSELNIRTKLEEKWMKDLSLDPHLFLEQWFNMPLFAQLNKHPNFKNLLNNRKERFHKNWIKAFEQYSPTKRPALWNQPLEAKTLYLNGELDSKYKKVAQNLKKKKWPNWEFRSAPQYGHNIHFENPDLYFSLISSFLDSDHF